MAKKKGPSCWKGYRAAGKKKSPSGKKTNSIKFTLSKNKESLVIECYSLNKTVH